MVAKGLIGDGRWLIRPENPGDRAAVRALLVEAFPTAAEADLVERLRRDGDARMALVAVEAAGRVVGQITLSAMRAPFRALGLAPVAVAADRRRRGIAAALIEESIGLARAAGWQGIFVVGDPAYYTRFGFDAGAAAAFESAYAGPYLMLLALDRDAVSRARGRAEYAPAFAGLEPE
jgi:putative acetyltransferase